MLDSQAAAVLAEKSYLPAAAENFMAKLALRRSPFFIKPVEKNSAAI